MRSPDLPPDIAVRLRHLMARGRLLRLARGAYTGARHYSNLRPWERHVLDSRALVQSCNPDVFLTGWSAVAIWRLPTLGKPHHVLRCFVCTRRPQSTTVVGAGSRGRAFRALIRCATAGL